ncbi:hypothetical protein Tco_0378268 [Tanacetum coccineum]
MTDDQPMTYGLRRGTIIQIFYHGLDEATQAILDAGGIFLYKAPNEAHQLLEYRVLLKLDWSKDMKAKPIHKTVAFTKSSNNSKLMEKIEALTIKIDSQLKDIKGEMKEMRDGCNSCGDPHPSSKCDDKPVGGPKDEEANYAYGGIEDEVTEKTTTCSSRPTGSLPSNTQTNPKPSPTNEKPYRPPSARNEHVNAIFTLSGLTYDLPVNPNAKTNVIHNDSEDEVDEAEKEHLRKEKMEERYAKFIDLIKEVRINVPLVDVLAGMPNYGKFLKDLVRNKSKMEQISIAFLKEECFTIVQNKLPPKLGDPESFLIPCTIAGSV